MSVIMRHWRKVWRNIFKKTQLDEKILEGETTYKAATANGNPEEQ